MLACVRSLQRGRQALGRDVDFEQSESGVPSPDVLSGCDAVVNLAGSPLVGRRWTRRRLAEAEASRVGVTEEVVRSLEAASPRPTVLVSVSAVGYYGDRPDGVVDESVSSGSGYLAGLCERWEEAARRAETLGVRTVIARLGVVLDRYGGTLAVLAPLFRARLGGRLSSGAQWFPWIHLDDVCRAVGAALTDADLSGPVNLVAPRPVRYKDFVDSLSKAMRVRAPWVMPGPMLRLVLKEGASALLGGAQVEPTRLADRGFQFDYPDLDSALAEIFESPPIVVSEGTAPQEVVSSDASADVAKKFGILVQSDLAVAASREEVFDFYSCPYNLEPLMPPLLGFEVLEAPEHMPEAPAETIVVYRSGKGPFERRYSGRIYGVDPPRRFFDASHAGTPIRWFHKHSFEPIGTRPGGSGGTGHDQTSEPNSDQAGDRSGCRISDDLWIDVLGRKVSGGVASAVARYLFDYRLRVVRRRFGRYEPSRASLAQSPPTSSL